MLSGYGCYRGMDVIRQYMNGCYKAIYMDVIRQYRQRIYRIINFHVMQLKTSFVMYE